MTAVTISLILKTIFSIYECNCNYIASEECILNYISKFKYIASVLKKDSFYIRDYKNKFLMLMNINLFYQLII